MRTMYDSITLANLQQAPVQPGDLLAGYDDGNWPDAPDIAAGFPGYTVVRVTTNPADNEGDVLDVETGDASPSDAPGWLQARIAAGASPSIYCGLDSWPAVWQAVAAAGLAQPPYWVAAYPGAGATQQTAPDGETPSVAHQYSDTPSAYDTSVVADYWPGVDPVPDPPTPAPPPEESDMLVSTIVDANGTYHVCWVNGFGMLMHQWRTAGQATWSTPECLSQTANGQTYPYYAQAPLVRIEGQQVTAAGVPVVNPSGWPQGGQIIVVAKRSDTNNPDYYAQANPGTGWGINSLG